MLYTTHNVRRETLVTDLDTRERVERVMRIDTATGEVFVAALPLRPDATGDSVETETIRFASIWPIMDRGIPCAFHCHGRQ